MKIHIASINTLLMSAFLIICVFFPGDPYHIKIVLFMLLCIFNIGLFKTSVQNNKFTYLFVMGTFFPACIALMSSIIGGNLSETILGVYPATLVLLVPIIVERNISYENILMKLLKLMAICEVLIVCLDFFCIIDVNDGIIHNIFYKYDMGLMGKSIEYAAYYKVFFKASPLMLIYLPYCFENNNYKMACITFIALICSGTRANIFVAVVVFTFGFVNIWSESKKNKANCLLLGIIMSIGLLLLLPKIISILQGTMSTAGSKASDAVRSGQMNSFLTLFKNPWKLFFGEGFGTSFFDLGRNSYTFSSEIAYFDLLRKIGLLFFLPFIVFLFVPFSFKIPVHYKVAYMGYLLSGFTNPLIFSSTAYVFYILLYSKEYSATR